MKKKNISIITLSIISLITNACHQFAIVDDLGNINYIIENKTGHKFTMALKDNSNSPRDSIIILNGETYSFWESGMAGYPHPFYERMGSKLNVYFDDVFIRSFDRSNNRKPHQYNFLLVSAYPDETQLNENTREAIRVMDEEFYKGLLESAKESNKDKNNL